MKKEPYKQRRKKARRLDQHIINSENFQKRREELNDREGGS